MRNKLLNKLWLRVGMIVAVMTTALAGTVKAESVTGTIDFGTNATRIDKAVVTAADSQGNMWTITTVGTTSFTTNSAYYQVGSSNKPATSITFTTTLNEDVSITAFNARFGGFSGTQGTVTLAVDDTTVGTGSLNETAAVTVSSTSTITGRELTVTVTNISKGVKVYYINYTYVTSSPSSPLSSIAVTGTTNVFRVGDTFTHDDAVVTATYEDESTKVVTANAEFSTPDMTTAGTKAVTVSYTENEVTKTTSYNIEVKAPTSISLSGTYPTEFTQGDEFSHDGVVVTANYGDGLTKDVTSEATFSSPDMTTTGTKTVTVTYRELTTSYDITVNEYVQPTEFVIDFEKALSTYREWTFNNIGTSNTAITAHGGSKYGANINENGNGVATGTITTNSKVNPESIAFYISRVTTNSTSSSWYVEVSSDGSSWTQVGGVESATDMAKGEWKEVSRDLSSYSNVYVRIRYNGSNAVRAIDDITLEMAGPQVLSSIALSGNYPTTFYANDAFSHEGMVVTATYESGKTADVTENATFSTPDMTALGTKTITVSYTEGEITKTATYEISVVEKKGTADNPYTVAEAIDFINTLGSATSAEDVYVIGIVSQVTKYNSDHQTITYWISDDGTTTVQMQVYSGKGLNGADFSSEDDLEPGDGVVVCGKVKMYGSTPEFDANSILVSLISKEKTGLAYAITTVKKYVGDENFTNPLTNPHNLVVSYTSSDETVATVDNNGEVTILAKGTTTITASYPEDETYREGSAIYTLTVKEPFPVEDGVFDFVEAGEEEFDYGSGIEFATTSNHWETEASTWTAGNVTLVAGGNYRWWYNGHELRFQKNNGTMTISVPAGRAIFRIEVLGGIDWTTNVGTYDNGTWTGKSQTVIFTAGNNEGNFVTKVVVTYSETEEVSVGDLKYSTYASDNALDFTGSSIKAFYPTIDAEGKTLIFHEITKVPAGTGVLLYSASGAVTEDIFVCTDELEALTDNLFVRGTGDRVSYTDTEHNYVLSKPQGNNLGFYKANNNMVATNRAYIQVPVEIGVKSFTINLEDDPTGIVNHNDNVNANEGAIYNLAGQRLSKMQKGINIINGKKVLK